MHEWVTLTTRAGAAIPSPDDVALRGALTELFSSAPDDEHPDCWIECGNAAGPLVTVSFFQSGKGYYTKYSDPDMTEELETKELKVSSVDAALEIWQKVIRDK